MRSSPNVSEAQRRKPASRSVEPVRTLRLVNLRSTHRLANLHPDRFFMADEDIVPAFRRNTFQPR